MDFSIILMPLITLITGEFIVLDLAKFRYPTKKLFTILVIEFIVQVTLCAAILLVFGYDEYVTTFIFCMDLPAIGTFLFVSKRRDFRDMFTVLITVFLSLAFSIPSMWLSQQLKDGYLWYNLFRVIIFLILFILLHKFVRKRYIQIQDELDKGWGIFCILPFIACLIMYSQYIIYIRSGDFSDIFINCVFLIAMIATIFMVFNYVLTQLHEKYLLQEQRRILTMQNKAQLEQFEQQREEAEKSNRRWHDLRHGIQQLIELLEDGNVDQAIRYLKEQRGAEQVPRIHYCIHPVINSMLCLWAERAKKVGIETEINTVIPGDLKIEPMELSVLFANAIENAYEACLRLSPEVHKFIKIQAQYNKGRLAIGITNSCLPVIPFDQDMPISVKKGGGIGTRSMAYCGALYRNQILRSKGRDIYS